VQKEILMTNLEELERKDKLKTKMLKYIMYKKRTEEEIKRKFANIEDSELVEEVMEELKEIGYINDESYIERAVTEHININNLSIKELKYKLMSKGLNINLIEDYIASKSEEMLEYEIESAKTIILKKQNTMEEQEIIQFLLKKGYRMDNIKEAILRLND
jgi:regulatory protein